MRRCWVAIIAPVVGLVSVHCGGKQERLGSQPSWRQRPAAIPAKDIEPIVFAPSRPAVSAYNADRRVEEDPSVLVQRIGAAATEVAVELAIAPPTSDARLSRAATELAAVSPPDSHIAYPLIEFAMQRHGIIEPSPHLIVVWGDREGTVEDVVFTVRERLASVLNTQTVPHTRFGVGSALRGDGEVCYVVAFQSSYIESEPIPRALVQEQSIEIRGRIRTPYTRPLAFLTRENGQVEEPVIRSKTSSSFRFRFDCAKHVGRQQIEITAVDDSGSTVLANFPVWCAAEPPARYVFKMDPGDGGAIATEAGAVSKMIELVNSDRARHGLEPLHLHQGLSAVARAHSTEMHTTGRVAHTSKTTGSAADRVDKAQIRTTVVLENVARAYGIAQTQDGLMNSPGHRANILSADVSHVGIGVVFGEPTDGRREMFVTQVFARIAEPLTAKQAQARLTERLLRGHSDTSFDRELTIVATTFARRVAAGESAQVVSRWASKELRRMRTGFASVSTVVSAALSVEDVDAAKELAEDDISGLGVGVARGDHPVMGASTYFVVLLLGQRSGQGAPQQRLW